MFWNEPNLYGYTYREVPHIPTPFYGQLAKLPFAGMTPWTIPQVPPVTPFYGMNFPQTLPVPPVTPFYGMNFPQNLPQVPFLPQFTQIPQINPVAFHGLPYRPF